MSTETQYQQDCILKEKYQLYETEYGYLSISPIPTKEDLALFYRDKYFQNSHGHYQKNYRDIELTYMNNQFEVNEWIFNQFNVKNYQLLDIGCGEGYFSKYFLDKGWSVTPIDYSDHSINMHNPILSDHFIQGDIFDLIKDDQNKYGVINIDNVLEHVGNPVELLTNIKKLLSLNSMIKIAVPNDFSLFQKMLLKNNFSKNTWLCPPEHLHYFNKNSLVKLLKSLGYKIKLVMGDFPIEQYIVNKYSNYTKEDRKQKGPEAHFARMTIDNFIFQQGIENYVKYYQACAEIEIGRQIIIYASLKSDISK